MLENQFQASIIKDIKQHLEGAIVLKNDPNYLQGVPDLLILYHDKWATLECKKNSKAKHQPNQEWYVEKMNEMSFSRFIFPENKTEVLNELYQSFKS